MKYLTGYTEEEAKQRSEEIAITQGCVGGTTKYWFQWIKHQDRDEWALKIPDESKITPEEVERLKEYSELDSGGWFPEIEEEV